jgi:hypothetical protein
MMRVKSLPSGIVARWLSVTRMTVSKQLAEGRGTSRLLIAKPTLLWKPQAPFLPRSMKIQGPRLVIEFSPQGVGGNPTMQVHTIYRDPTNDYGVKLTGAM